MGSGICGKCRSNWTGTSRDCKCTKREIWNHIRSQEQQRRDLEEAIKKSEALELGSLSRQASLRKRINRGGGDTAGLGGQKSDADCSRGGSVQGEPSDEKGGLET